MKLFKKAMAAVLAGVMALSMVACAPGGNVPVPDPKPESTTPEAQFFDILNTYSAAKGVIDQKDYPVFENELKAEAQAVLDAIKAGAPSFDSNTGKVTARKLTAAQATALNKSLNGATLYRISTKADYNIGNADQTLDMTYFAWGEKKTENIEAVKSYLSTNFRYLTTTKTTTIDGSSSTPETEVVAAYKLGMASAVIDDQLCVVYVYKKV